MPLKGYQFAEVKPVITPVEGAAKRVNVTFAISEGPKVAVRDVQFLGNRVFTDDQLADVVEGQPRAGVR